MAMKILVVLSVLFACGMAVPQIPPNFYTKMSVEYWNGTMLTFQSTEGYSAQNHDRNMSIICMNYTEKRCSQIQTECYMTTTKMNSSDVLYVHYLKTANGTLLLCDQSNEDTADFYGLFDWVANTKQVGKCNDTCNQEVEQWECEMGDTTSLSVGVTDKDPNIPVFSKFYINFTNSEEQRYISCFTDFKSEVPPQAMFAIPNNCQSASKNSELYVCDPEKIRFRMADHMRQHQIKLKNHVRPQL